MTDYVYQDGKFGNKDLLPPLDPSKILIGADFEEEFPKIEAAVNSKMNTLNPVVSGTMTGGTIDGGTY